MLFSWGSKLFWEHKTNMCNNTGGQEALFCFWQDRDPCTHIPTHLFNLWACLTSFTKKCSIFIYITPLEGNTNQIPNLSSRVLRCRHIRGVLICMMTTYGLPSRPDWSGMPTVSNAFTPMHPAADRHSVSDFPRVFQNWYQRIKTGSPNCRLQRQYTHRPSP